MCNNKITNYIITGEINSGKTTKLISIYKKLGYGDGFALTKIYMDNNYIGQNIVRLSSGKGRCFSFKRNHIPLLWDKFINYENYSFSKQGLLFANEIINEILMFGIEPIFIDEIGPLEILGSGFYSIFSKILKANKELYFTTRKDCLEEVISFFKISDYTIIQTNY